MCQYGVLHSISYSVVLYYRLYYTVYHTVFNIQCTIQCIVLRNTQSVLFPLPMPRPSFLDEVNSEPFDAPLEEFHNKKLMNKLIQQIHDPMVLSSGSLPEWCYILTLSYPLLFPFEVREVFFNCTAFGTSRYASTPLLKVS